VLSGLRPPHTRQLLWGDHLFQDIAEALYFEPKVQSSAKHAGQDQCGCGGDVAAIGAQFIDVLSLSPTASASAPEVSSIGSMNSSVSI
jgi:hypothetical protein